MKCPRCRNEQYCPCASCTPRHPEGVTPWEWENGEAIRCGYCGLTMHADWWEDEAYRQVRPGFHMPLKPLAFPPTD